MNQLNNLHNNTILTKNPQFGFGLQMVNNLRLLVFEAPPKSLCIDFVSQHLESGRFYIIPNNHFHFISRREKCSFYCLDINESNLSYSERKMLYSIKYLQQKSVGSQIPNSELFALLEHKNRNENNDEINLNQLKEWLFEPDSFFLKPISNPSYKHLLLAEKFLILLGDIDFRLDECVIENFINKLHCSERTLQRACISSFGSCAKDVLKYHILLKATHLLCQQGIPITTISKSLGFSTVSVFDKFIKRLTKTTPKDIQQRLISLGM